MGDRFEDLEMKLAFQERAIERLDEAFRDQNVVVGELESRLARLERRFAGADAAEAD